MNFGRIINHTIKIEASRNNGFFVTVGCGRFAYSDKDELVKDLKAYLDNPEKLEAEYSKISGEECAEVPGPIQEGEDCPPTAGVPVGNPPRR